MRAAVFRDFNAPLEIDEVAEPQPAADQLVIRVARCGICGSDLHLTREPAMGVQPGAVLGHEFSGEVVELGTATAGFKVGDRVAVAPVRGCGQCPSCHAGEPAWCESMLLQGGGYAEFAVATDRQCLRLPTAASVEDGALVEPLAVALHGVALSGLAAGSRVLILGAGPIGLAVAFWCRRLGATQVGVVDLTPLQAELAKKVGATAFVQAGEDVVKRATATLGGAPDVVFECVGKPGILAQALEHVRPRGSIVMLGLCTTIDSFVPFRAVSKEVKFITSAFFNMREYETSLDLLDGGHAEARALITDTIPLSNLPTVFESLRQRTSQCKVMVRP
jgi:(R,R)-butanediol dehydrogenase / meso-butanediol dehydrogenase / diacetyl reductase